MGEKGRSINGSLICGLPPWVTQVNPMGDSLRTVEHVADCPTRKWGCEMFIYQLSFLTNWVAYGALIPLNLGCRPSTTTSDSLQPQKLQKQRKAGSCCVKELSAGELQHRIRGCEQSIESFCYCKLDYVTVRKTSTNIYWLLLKHI